MRIQAFRRSAPVSVSIGGAQYDFVVNDHGDVVADVADAEAARGLLEIETDYRAYGRAAKTEQPPETADGEAPTGEGAPRKRGRPPKAEQP